MSLILNTIRNKSVPQKAWELNERHYGALTGLNKEDMMKKYGEKKFMNLEDLGKLNLNL